MSLGVLHCKKRLMIFPSPAGIKFPPREGLGSDIPAGDGKMVNLFLRCRRIWQDSFGVFSYALKYFLHILWISLNTFRARTILCTTLTLSYSSYTLKYFPRILRIPSTMPDAVKGTIFWENGIGEYTYTWTYYKFKQREKPEKVTFLRQFLTKPNNFWNLCFVPQIGLNDQKTISRCCPFKWIPAFFPVLVYDIDLWNALLYSSMDTSRKNNVF